MSGLLESKRLATLAREESVRGLMIRRAIEEAGQADSAGRRIIENALQLLLERFGTDGEGTP